MMALVWEHFPGERAYLTLALALADHADHDGDSIFPGIPGLASKTRQSERSVQRQLRALELSTWLECIEMSNGGRNRTSRYRINPAWIAKPSDFAFNGDKMSPFARSKPRQTVTVSDPVTVTIPARNGDTAMSPAENQKQPSVEITSSPMPPDRQDRAFAELMFSDLRQLNPGHKEPAWSTWLRDIRLMREQDKRTHEQMLQLWKFAHADPFWRINVLSPGKLRKQWDALAIRRGAKGQGLEWWQSWSGIEAKARELGLARQERESPPTFKERVLSAARASGLPTAR